MNEPTYAFERALDRALRVGEDAAHIAYTRGPVVHEDAIGFSLIYLEPGAPFTKWALQAERAFIGFDGLPLLYVTPLEDLPLERPEICSAQAHAVARSLTNSGVPGLRVEDCEQLSEATTPLVV